MTEPSFTLPSFAKINWRLRVLGRRADGFHELCTIFQTVSLADELHFAPAEGIELVCDAPHVPTGETNLVVRAARALAAEYGVRRGARIRLVKRIPAPGGLGGGSSNAAVALLGLAALWRLETSRARLAALGARLGSDVPFFLYGGTAFGAGRGTEITPLADAREPSMLIATPAVDVPTAEAFRRLNAPNLTNEASKSILKICQNEASGFDFRQRDYTNDFERSVYEYEPEIGRVRQELLDAGAVRAVLSGSGASVFAVFDKEETRQATLKALENEFNWRMFAVATVSVDEYRRALARAFEVVSD